MTTWYGCTEALKTSPAAASSPNSDRIGKGIPGATMYRNARLKSADFRYLRHADCIEQSPLSGVTRKTFAHTEFFSV
jgi:hypothetical protein